MSVPESRARIDRSVTAPPPVDAIAFDRVNTAYLFLLVPLVIWGAAISALVSAARVPESRWHVAGESRAMTMVGILLTGGLGGLYYWTVVRRRLDRAANARQEAALAEAPRREWEY